jgi:hypothetical protein
MPNNSLASLSTCDLQDLSNTQVEGKDFDHLAKAIKFNKKITVLSIFLCRLELQ